MFTPKTASEAARLAVLTERAQQILTEGYSFWPDAEAGFTAVCKPGKLAAAYWITDGKCDCPARQKDATCKHEIAAMLKSEEEAMWSSICAEVEERTAREEEFHF